MRAALRFALVPQDVAVDPIAAVMQRLIDRRLMLAEVDRYAPPEPTPAAVDAAMAAIERRYKDALEMEIALNQSAMSREELRRYVRDTLRLEAYFQQRFSTVVQPSEDDILRYYREHAAEFTVAGKLQPLDAVREAARAAVIREQREVLRAAVGGGVAPAGRGAGAVSGEVRGDVRSAEFSSASVRPTLACRADAELVRAERSRRTITPTQATRTSPAAPG